MNKRVEKVVNRIKEKGNHVTFRRDQLKKAVSEGAFDYMIYRGYDEIYHVEDVKTLNPTEKDINDFWFNGANIYASIEADNTFVVKMYYGYSSMKLFLSLDENKDKIKKDVKVLDVRLNEKLNGVEILFSDVPDDDIKEALKSNGFKWSGYNGVWWNKQSEESIKFAYSFIMENIEETEEVQEVNNTIEVPEVAEIAATTEEVKETIKPTFDNVAIEEVKGKEIFVNALTPNLNKNCNIEVNNREIEESSYISEYYITKIIKLNEEQYNYFYNNLLDDYDFLQGQGGWEEDEQGNFLYYYAVAVYCENKEILIIDPSGCSYARYTCKLVEGENLQNEIKNNTVVDNERYKNSINNIIDNELYQVNFSKEYILEDNRIIVNSDYNFTQFVTGYTIKELLKEGKNINILNLQTIKYNKDIFIDDLKNKTSFIMLGTEIDMQIDKINMYDRYLKEINRIQFKILL